MKTEEIESVITNNINLTNFGLMEVSDSNYIKARKDLYSNLNTVSECIDWMSANYVANVSTKNLSSSYGLKHIIEKDLGHYVSNGCLVAAVEALHISCKKFDQSDSNIYLPFNLKSLNEIKQRINDRCIQTKILS